MSSFATDVDLGAVLLRVAEKKLGKRGVRVDPRVVAGTLERTMSGASTLELVLNDHDRTLLRSGLFDRQIDLELEGLWWRLVKVGKAGDELTLTFEDRAVSYLRKITTPRKAARAKMTRAEFALSIVREVKGGGGIPFVCPDLHLKQPIEKASQKKTDAKRTAEVAPGLAAGAKLTVKGAPATAEQRGNAQRCLDVADSLGAGERASLALIQAVIVESTIRNLDYGDLDSLGILQVRSSTARGMSPPIDNRDVEACANAFLTRGFWGKGGAIAIAAKNPTMSTGMVAQNTQGSGVPGAYDKWTSEARAWLAAYTGGGIGGTISASSITKTLPYQFQRGGTDGELEDSWTCLQRLASEVQWRCFMAEGSCYFVAETTLIKQKPRAVLSEDTLGISYIDFDVDNGKATSDATVTARAMLHGFPPGSVVMLDDCGPADGRWLVYSTSRSLFDPETQITLRRPLDPLPEPAADTTTVSAGGASSSDVALESITGDSPVARAYMAALAIDAKVYPYVWGGGHAHAGTPDGGTGRDPGIGYDCSGSTGAVLAAAGMGYSIGSPVPGSIAMMSWGEAGEGQGMTLWANHEHVWLEFKVRGDQHFGTGEWGISNPRKGPRFQGAMHFKNTFTPRHWPGT